MSTVRTCGYVNCICRDCMAVAVCGRPAGQKHMAEHHLCSECEEAGCDATGKSECENENQRFAANDNGEEADHA